MTRHFDWGRQQATRFHVSGGPLPRELSPARRVWLAARQRRLRAEFERRQEAAAASVLYPTRGRDVLAVPAGKTPNEGAAAMTTVEARGMGGRDGGAVSATPLSDAVRARGAHLTAQAPNGVAREGRQDDQSHGPATSAAPASGSRTGAVPCEAPAQLTAAGRTTHRGEFDECSE